MAHKHNIQDDDTHFIIDTSAKEIIGEPKTIVQHDHNSERITFDMDASTLVEGHDMSQCDKIEIHFINNSFDNSAQSGDVYPVEDMQISQDGNNTITFSWLISGNGTKYAGTLNFLIKFICLDGTNIDYEWNTQIFSKIIVSDGMNNGEMVIAEYSDVLEAWKSQILGEVNNLLERSEEAVKKAEDAAQRAEDVASGVNGATFFPVVSENGIISWTNDKGLENPTPVNIKGNDGVGISKVESKETIEGEQILEITLTNGDKTEYNLGKKNNPIKNILFYENPKGEISLQIEFDDYSIMSAKLPFKDCGITSIEQTTGDSETAVMSQKAVTSELNKRTNSIIGVATGESVFIDDISPIEHKVSVTLHSKNLLTYPYHETTRTVNGVTFTDNGDGSITINGTNTGTTYSLFMVKSFMLIEAGTYTLSGVTGGSNSTFSFVFGSSDWRDIGNGVTRTYTEDIKQNIFIRVEVGATLNNVTIYPQLERGTVKTAYAPYVSNDKQIIITSGDESVTTTITEGAELTSKSPTMTIETDTEGVIIECTYNRDVVKVISTLEERIAALELAVASN